MDQNTLMKALDLVYDKAVDGIPGTSAVPGMGSVEDFAQGYMKGEGSLEDKVNSLIRFQVAKASAAGFATGLGGVLTLPVAVPANLASVFYVQLQMVAAIAYMGGYDVRDDRVKTFCYVCLCGDAAGNVLREASIKITTKLTEQMIKRLSFEVIKKINKIVGFRLLTKFGQTGVINLGKTIPVVGGVVSGTFDGSTSYAIGKAAKRTFITGEPTQVMSDPGAGNGRFSRIARKVSLQKKLDFRKPDRGEVIEAEEIYADPEDTAARKDL